MNDGARTRTQAARHPSLHLTLNTLCIFQLTDIQSDADTHTVAQVPVCSTHPNTLSHKYTHIDIPTFTDTLEHFKAVGSHIHTLFYTTTYFHAHSDPADIYISAQLSHAPVPFTLTHQDVDTNTWAQKIFFGVTQPPLPCPALQPSALSGAHAHAKLAGRVTDWQARHYADHAGPSQEKGREVSQPPASG